MRNWPLAGILALAGLLCTAGCRTARVSESSAVSRESAVSRSADTVRARDTLVVREYARDSVVVERRGDTVYVDRWRERWARSEARAESERVSVVRDTVVRTDTVIKRDTAAGKASGKEGGWRRAAAWIAGMLLLLAVMALAGKRMGD